MIKIIGTTHLMKKDFIEEIIKKENPDMIGVELCKTRFDIFSNPLEQREKDESLVGEISDELNKKAQEENLDYGSDMKTAMFYAINNKIPLLLLDKEINEIKKSMEEIPLKEQLILKEELIKFKNDPLQKEIDESEIMKEIKNRIPITYHILVESRDNYIIDKIKVAELLNKRKKILIFLGKVHAKSILGRINQWIK
jgi:pheromone shutdown protein TraB